MKVALITSNFSYFNLHWKTLIEFLDSKGCKIIFISNVDNDLTSYARKNNHEILNLNISRSSLNLFSVIRDSLNIFKVLKDIKPDIVHSFYLKPSMLSLFSSVFLRKKIKFFFHITGLGFLGNSKSFKSKILFFLTRKYFSFAISLTKNSKIILETPFLKKYVATKFNIPERKISLISGVGINVDKFKPSNKPNERNNKIKFLMVARLLKDKGIIEYHRAAKIIKEDNADVEFYLIGSIDLANPESIDENELNDIKSGPLIFIGEKKSLEKIYINFDVFVLPSYHEGLSVSAMEAGSSGLCLLLSDIPGCRELVNPDINGFLFEPRSEKSLIESIKKVIINRHNIQIFGSESRKIIKSFYSKEVIIKQLSAIYSEE